MKKLHVTLEGITDTTGYLFSLAKCFAAVLKNSEYKDYAEDIIAASGFAFRMWVDGSQLCPSATSIWDFKQQKEWFENSGLICEYRERLWGEDAIEEERRLAAIALIRQSIDKQSAVVAWDVSGCEWGIITGYDDTDNIFSTLKIDGSEDCLSYEKLGRLEIPILSVLAVAGKQDKTVDELVADTKKLAVSHLNGMEWCENAKGLAAYDALIAFIKERLTCDTAWNLEYYLGTYTALKWYAWQFFEKYGEAELAEKYRTVYDAWKAAFDMKCSGDVTKQGVKEQIAGRLLAARNAEREAVWLMEYGLE